jgi:hypothetical protein
MAALPEPRRFAPAVQSIRGEEPLLIGLIGPPGGGKTVSALRLATGMRKVRPGPVVLIDTEGGRSKKYSPEAGRPANPASLSFDFLRVEMTPDFRSHDFLAAIKAQLPLNPAAIIVDTLSDEHEGEGGFLEWHDKIAGAKKGEAGYVGGNEWAAWAMPKASRKRLISGLMQIKVPLLFTFRAREKTKTEAGKNGGRDTIVNIGYMPVAPLEIVHGLDLTCILPPRANGVPVWTSEKIGEDFIIKLPAFLAPLIRDGALSEETGEALASWAKGESASPTSKPAQAPPPQAQTDEAAALVAEVKAVLKAHGFEGSKAAAEPVLLAFGKTWVEMTRLPADQLAIGLAALRKNLEGLAALKSERQPG